MGSFFSEDGGGMEKESWISVIQVEKLEGLNFTSMLGKLDGFYQQLIFNTVIGKFSSYVNHY